MQLCYFHSQFQALCPVHYNVEVHCQFSQPEISKIWRDMKGPKIATGPCFVAGSVFYKISLPQKLYFVMNKNFPKNFRVASVVTTRSLLLSVFSIVRLTMTCKCFRGTRTWKNHTNSNHQVRFLKLAPCLFGK